MEGEWTITTAKAHVLALLTELEKRFLAILEERDKRYEQQFKAAREAVATALTAMEARLSGMNEFRGSLTDAQKTFITRAEHNKLADDQKNFVGRSEVIALLSVSAVLMLGIVSAVIALLRK
jgi:hypothetical protein